mmetsp:Transcript_92399/g.178090  ORF Transcript_92399/g.178090 Transcript_92399/m.178090 type:complete len:200 (-) Transcript_92399:1754-2353(-)
MIEKHHVGFCNGAFQLEAFLNARLLDFGKLFRSHLQGKVHIPFSVVLTYILQVDFRPRIAAREHCLQKLFVILGPFPNGQLSDLNTGAPLVTFVPLLLNTPCCVESLAIGLDASLKATVPWFQGFHLLALHPEPEVLNDSQWVVVGHICAPACANTACAIHKHHWDDGCVPTRLNTLAIFQQVAKDGIVVRMENQARDW